MKYDKIIFLICIVACILFSLSCVFANDVMNETVGVNDLDSQDLQLTSSDANDSRISSDLSSSTVYFDASASSDGVGSKSNPYKYYKADRINFGDSAYFADGVYTITEANSIYSSSTYKTTFIGQSSENTIFISNLKNKFDFTVTDNSYFVLNNVTMIGVHINNQANLVANDVVFRDSSSFNPTYPPSLSYASKIYDSTYGGMIVCDTPSNRITTLKLTDCYFTGSSASSGGAIAAYNSIVDIQNCVFYNSSATRFGGAIYSIKSSFNIYDSSFELSSAKYAGAIYSNSSNFNLRDSQFIKSQAYSFGGVIAAFSSHLDIDNVIFNDYSSLNDAGGAIYSVGGTLDVTDSSFKSGFSDFGGAICNLKTNSTISNCEFAENSAQYYGGSIYNMYGTVELTSNIFNGSNATSGGSIFNRLSDSFKLVKNRFINSTANTGDIVFIDGDNVNVVQNGNVYDSSYNLLKYGNIYEIDYHQSVPIIEYTVESSDSIPSFYDSRAYGYITPAKDQIQGGNCWAFSGIATLEACLMKATGIAYDFSEENVKNLMSEYSLFDSDNGVNGGGNLYMFIAYLAGWFGPTYDEYDVYDDYSSLSVIYDSLIHVQNVYILPERGSFYDNEYIKKAVMDYGAVSIGIDLSQNQGHAVTIVGWDDEFVSNDFLGNKAVGAWIIKNSWGTSWGYDGFGYLSYQHPISFGYTFILDGDKGYTDIYQYDFAGKRGTYSIDSSEVYLKNKFTAKNNEILSAFSTYFDEPSNFTASIYLNGKLVSTQNGIAQKGYYTMPLANEVSLKKGDSFEVVVKIFNGAPVYIPISPASEMNKINFGKGISFYSVDGVNWNDLYESNVQGVACIKAFTRSESLSEISIGMDQTGGSNLFDNVYVDDLVNIQLNLPQYYAVDGIQHPVDGLVTFLINGEYYYATVENGKACLNVSFEKAGAYDVTAQFKSSRMVSNLLSFKVNVADTAQSNLVIQSKDVSKFYGGSEKYVATLYDGDKALSGVNVKITVNGKDYTVKTDGNGQVILDLDLPVGAYEVLVQYGGKRVSSKFTVLTTIGVENITNDFLNSYVSASFLNTDGSFLTGKEVSFSIEYYDIDSIPGEFKATTNNVGVASAKINYYVGKYKVSVVNPVNNEKKEFTLEISRIDSQCSLAVTQTGSNSVTISAYVNPTCSFNYIGFTGYVNFLFSGNVHKVKVQKILLPDGSGYAIASRTFSNLAVGDYSVSAFFFGDDNFTSSSDAIGFSVTEKPYKLSSGNYENYYGASGTMVQITDPNNNNKGVKGELVSATVANKTYYNTTDEDGLAYFILHDLEAGNYTVLFEHKGQSLLKYVFVKSSIDIATLSGEYLNSKLEAYFAYPYDGERPDKLDVKFIVNGTEYTSVATFSHEVSFLDEYVVPYYKSSVDVDLLVGTHTFTAINLCNGERKQSEITIYKTTPTITLSRSKLGNGILFTTSLKQTSAIGNVVFTMGSNKYTTAIRDGKAILAMSVLDEGYYEIYANYIGDPNFNNILSATMEFDHVHTNYTLSAPKISKYYGGSEEFTLTLTNYNKPVSNVIVNVVVGDKTYNFKTDSNGVASYNLVLDPGVYSVECSYDDVSVSSEITVKSTISVNGANDISYTKTTAELLDGNGNLIKNKIATFKIGSTEYKVTTDGLGVATLEPNLNKGNYTVAITNPVTGEIKYSTLIITKSTPTLTLSVVKQDGVEVLKAVLPKTATGHIDFVIDEYDEYSFELKNGVAILEGLDSGEYNVVVNYIGDDEYNAVSKSIKFTVSEVVVESVLTSSKVTTTYGTSKNIVITLMDSKGNILVGRQVTVTLNNKKYYTVIPEDGKAIVSVPSSLVPKTYAATITYDGETNILGKTIQISVVVNKATPKLTASKKTFKLKDKTKKYVVTLKTNKNKVYKNQKITIKVKGKTYTAKTNSKGQATFKLTKLTKKGTFSATVKFSANSYYKTVSKKVKITVK